MTCDQPAQTDGVSILGAVDRIRKMTARICELDRLSRMAISARRCGGELRVWVGESTPDDENTIRMAVADAFRMLAVEELAKPELAKLREMVAGVACLEEGEV